jgi:hypothetical protein
MPLSGGKYFTETSQGRVFIGSTAAAGVAAPISTGTAVTFGIWNTSTTKWAVPLWLSIGYTSGTIALGEWGVANQNCGFAIGTAAPLSAVTSGTPVNGLLGSGLASSLTFIPATATLTAGGTACKWLGSANESATAGTGEVGGFYHDFDGGLIVRPGQLLFVCGSVAQTGIFTMSMGWSEIPALS